MVNRAYKDYMNFFANKRILITGHTGFKGSWLVSILLSMGANVTGYALEPPTEPSLFNILNLSNLMNSVIGDIRDYNKLRKVILDIKPDIIIHMAAQPIVRESYIFPRETYEINVMGTVNICEAIREAQSVKSFLNVTTDKVYLNREYNRGYVESDALDGYDPYSNSKSCSELVTHSYNNSFFSENGIAVSTARAGNVIGGGDFAKDRIIPDCIRAVETKTPLIIRNPHSVRPFQHVLEPLFVYLTIVKKQYENISYADYYNVGPDKEDCVTTQELVKLFADSWGRGFEWKCRPSYGPHEANLLMLECSKIKDVFNWEPVWNIKQAVDKTVQWTKIYEDNRGSEDISNIVLSFMKEQINDFLLCHS